MYHFHKRWKYPAILLGSIGLSSVGSWIYFIALNLLIFQMTGSAAAVAALYVIRPIAALFTNLWGGSFIDRRNKRCVMICLDFLQVLCLILMMFFISHLYIIYLLVFLMSMLNSIFDPTSSVYITKLIPEEQRQRFNAWRSMLDSGAFFLGPAIAGVLFMINTPLAAIAVNAVTYFISALITCFIPDVEKSDTKAAPEKISLFLIKQDVKTTVHFSRTHLYIMGIYFLFGLFIVLQTAVDSMEVAFAKEVVNLSDGEYGFLVSIAGAGILAGAAVNVMTASKFSVLTLLGGGAFLTAAGYFIFAYSFSFLSAAAGFFLLAFFSAFANAGYHTFYQNHIPADIMGRVRSFYSFIEAALVIFFTLILVIFADFINVEAAVKTGVWTIVISTAVLFYFTRNEKRILRSAAFDDQKTS